MLAQFDEDLFFFLCDPDIFFSLLTEPGGLTFPDGSCYGVFIFSQAGELSVKTLAKGMISTQNTLISNPGNCRLFFRTVHINPSHDPC